VNVANTTIGAGGITLRAVFANGAANGNLSSEHGIHGFALRHGQHRGGCGGDTTANTPGLLPVRLATAPNSGDCSGGQIQNTAGADGSTAGTAIYLDGTLNPSFTRVRLSNNANWAIRGNNVTGFTLAHSLIDGTNGTSDVTDDGAVYFTGLTGAAPRCRTSASAALWKTRSAWSNTSGTLNRLVIDKCQIAPNSTTLGNDAIDVESSGTATLNVTVSNCVLTGAKGDVLNFNNLTGSTMDTVVTGNAGLEQSPVDRIRGRRHDLGGDRHHDVQHHGQLVP
jgi:hypothetical protein